MIVPPWRYRAKQMYGWWWCTSLAGWKNTLSRRRAWFVVLFCVVFCVSNLRSYQSLDQLSLELKILHTSAHSLKSYHIWVVAAITFTKLRHLNPTDSFQAQYFTVPPESTCYIAHRLYKNVEISDVRITHHRLYKWQAVIQQTWLREGLRTAGLHQKSSITDSSGKYNLTCTP